MPLYAFVCLRTACGKTFDVIRPIADRDASQACPHCAAAAARLVTAAAWKMGSGGPSGSFVGQAIERVKRRGL